MKRNIFFLAAFITALTLLSGCATTNFYKTADTLGATANFKKEYIKTDLCVLTSFHKFTRPDSALRVYVEGDGFAWRTYRELSDDPTPHNQLMLTLAGMDPSENVAYLARPGQLTGEGKPDCDSQYWSVRRYSPEVIDAMNLALERLKAESRAKEIELIGFSGGAAIAVIIASERKDIVSIRTISGGLDNDAITKHNRVSPLDGSLNPIDFADKVKDIPQRHFTGAKDDVVPSFVVKSFAEKIGDERYESVTVIKKASHSSGWENEWGQLLKLSLYSKRQS